MKKWFLLSISGILVFLFVFLVGTKPAPKSEEDKKVDKNENVAGQTVGSPDMIIDSKKTYSAVIETSKGKIVIALFAKEVPKTVNNFVYLSRKQFYDGVVFHRIIKDFMIQTGDPKGDGTGGPGYQFEDEPITRDYLRGTLAMANSGPNTNGSQFFIIHKDYQLPKNYTIFGKIDESDAESFKTLDSIAETPVETSGRGENSKPTEKVFIKTVAIEEK